MTEAQIHEAYVNWLPESERAQAKDFTSTDFPTVNFDVFEDEETLVNRIYFLIPHLIEGHLSCFIFYEENTFQKGENGDMDLIRSEHGIEKPVV